MYRRPKSLEVILAIRTTMSEEAGYDIPAFLEIVRTGTAPADKTRTVTRVEGTFGDQPQPETITKESKVEVSDQ